MVMAVLLTKITLRTCLANFMSVDNSVNVLQNGFDWASLQNKKVVDVGGGNGHISIDLAKVRRGNYMVLPLKMF